MMLMSKMITALSMEIVMAKDLEALGYGA